MSSMRNSPNINPSHKQVTREQVAALPKVVLHDHLDTSGARGEADIEVAARTAVAELAEDHVVYAELRLVPELNLDVLSLEQVVAAATRGVRADERIDARLILTALRDGEHVAEVAGATVAIMTESTDDTVVGFDLAGGEGPVEAHAQTMSMLREHYVPVTVHAGAHAGIESIAQALAHGAVRLGHGARVFEDFEVGLEGVAAGQVSAWVRDRAVCLELAPSLEVEMGVVDEFADHPLTLLHQMGFTCTLNPGQRSVTSLTDEMMRLVDTFDYGYDELFDLTRTALENAFVPVPRRTEILAQHILPAYEDLTGEYNEDVAFATGAGEQPQA